MIKNTDKIADKQAEELSEEQQKVQDEKKAKEKAEQIAIAKKKMTEALNAAPVKKAEVAKNKTASPTQVVAQITKAVQAPPIPVAKPEIA